ncbi:MAG TPA: VIT domain-containing protein, partial [Thermoanaerobaculia bacterium]|nr:VIT domain-containing protein [Thermoanaerobaculia bacterium]
MKLHRLLLIAVLVVSSSLFAAERRTIPTLTATDAGGATALALTRATIRVTIRGPLARTELQLTYRNDLDRELSGDFFFPLPPNAEVSDLGLYFDGHLRHAVAVERVLAKQAYDEVSHRGVDPALAEYNAGRGFRFRVYPIPAEGEKQVFLAYDEELGTSDYRLDLRYGRTIDTDITIDAEGRAVTIEGSVPRSHATQLLDGTIRIAGANEERALAARAADGTWYAAAALAVDAHAAELPPAPEVTVVWDTSSSSVQQNGKALREFLNGFLEQQLGSANVNVVPFHVAVEAPRRIAKNALTRTLDDLQPLGATNLIDLAHRLPQLAATLPPNGRLILVTDGLTSFGDSRDVAAAFTKLDALHVPLLIVNASNSADDALLTNAASAARGWYVDLTHTDVQTAIETAMHLPAAARLKSSAASLLPSAVVATANEAIVAAARASTPIVALPISITTANGTTTRELPVTELRAPVEVSMVQRTWARARLRELIARGADDGEIIAHGRKFNQLTPRTSLLVLDSWRDYELYDIPMPEDVAAEKERASLDRESPPFFTTSTNVTPQPPAGSWFIKGRVTESGAPLPGATVTMRDGERILATQVSDSDGRWWIAFATPPQ